MAWLYKALWLVIEVITLELLYLFLVRQRALASGKDQEICQRAIDMFKITCSSLCDGSITMIVLGKLQNDTEHIQKLCDAITVDPANKSQQLQAQYSFELISGALTDRLKEYEAFQDHFKILKNLVRYLAAANLNIIGKNIAHHILFSKRNCLVPSTQRFV